MRHLLIALITLLAAPFAAQEKIVLTTPETVVSNPEYRIETFALHLDDPATSPADEGTLNIILLGQTGERVFCNYTAATTPTGTFLNNALNKVNASTAYAGNATTGTLKQRVCHRLVIMGESTAVCGKTITGTCTGSVP